MALTNEPLTEAQKALPSGMIFPSGEANFYDFSQNPEFNGGSGINANFPSPSDFSHEESGLLRTYGPEGTMVDNTGIFNFAGEVSNFSSAKDVNTYVINDYSTFNAYIHYGTGIGGAVVQIPYASTSTIAAVLNPYPY